MNDQRSAPFQAGIDNFQGYAVRDPEAFARNAARMLEHLGKAAAAWVEPRERGEVRDGPISYTDVVSTLSEVGDYWLSDHQRAFQAQAKLMSGFMGIWANSMARAAGQPVAPPAPDKRFADEDWQRHPLFAFLRESYGVVSEWANGLAQDAEGVDPHTRHKAIFYTRAIVNALSPANFLATNPELYRETMAENGENLVRGMRMFAEDMARGEGFLKLRQSCENSFKVGENVATTPGKVIAENELCQIIQYAPSTETVFKRPILISPPWINRFYILDLNAEKSLIRWMVEQGHTVFVISWVNPDARHADKDWQNYIEEGLVFGLDTVQQVTGESEVNAVGYCVGGTLLGAALPYLKARSDERIRSATFLTTQIDFRHSGDLKVFVDEQQLAELEKTMERGYLEGTRMAATFNLLRSGELIWPYVVSNYLKGKEPAPFDLLSGMPTPRAWLRPTTSSICAPAISKIGWLARRWRSAAFVSTSRPSICRSTISRPKRITSRPRSASMRKPRLRRAVHLCGRRVRPHRRRRQSAIQTEVPFLDRGRAVAGRELSGLVEHDRRNARLLVAALAGLD